MSTQPWTELPALVDDPTLVPGSPTPEQVESASEAVRAHCGWHIAPVIEQDVVLDAEGGYFLHLPTLALVEVLSVQDLSGATPVDVTDWRMSTSGMLSRPGGWPDGLGVVRVVFRHGFPTVPAGLLPVLGTVSTRRVRRESLAGRSVELDDYEAQLHHGVLERFRLENQP